MFKDSVKGKLKSFLAVSLWKGIYIHFSVSPEWLEVHEELMDVHVIRYDAAAMCTVNQ